MSAAVEVAGDEGVHFGGVGFGGLGFGGVEGAQAGDDAVDHGGGEYAVFFEYGAHFFETAGGVGAVDGQFGELGHFVGGFGAVDVDVDIGLGCHVERVFHLEAVAQRYGESGQELIYVGRAVG